MDASSSTRARFFNAIAHRYERAYALPPVLSRPRMDAVLAALPPAARLLDLGVGTGRELSALLDAGHSPTGLDFSEEMLAICKRRARPVPLVLGDLWQTLPFPDGAFDAVVALHGTLAHPESDAALARLPAELARVLSPTGVLVAEVPSPAWLATLDEKENADSELFARRTASDRCVHEDTVARVAIEAVFLSEEAWRALLEPHFTLIVEPIGSFELRLVGRRNAS